MLGIRKSLSDGPAALRNRTFYWGTSAIALFTIASFASLGVSAETPSAERVISLFSAQDDPGRNRLELINADQTKRVMSQGAETLIIETETAPCVPSAWLFRLHEGFPGDWKTLYLDIEFVDDGAGVIQPRLLSDDTFSGTWAEPVHAVSYTRLNTHTVRHALFQFLMPNVDWPRATHPHLRILGLQQLCRITASQEMPEERWQQLRNAIPAKVTPMVRLQRPMQINCTVGIADIGNPPPIEQSMENAREYVPLARVLGFTSAECFVRWDLIEPKKGEFDFSYYDRIVSLLRTYDLKWFPNLVITSAFALPQWYYESHDYSPFRCIEHGDVNQSPSIWTPVNREHVARVLQAFGAHYGPMGVLDAVRLGPSGNFGEAQYPAGAGGVLGYHGERMHAHIGWWAGSDEAKTDFQRWLNERYHEVSALNAVWDEKYSAWGDVSPRLPETFRTRRARLDFTEWYTASMTQWCGYWAQTARKALPDTMIYQSAGSWGYRESGTDFSALAESMQSVHGGIRLTNETDSFEQDFYATRMAATSARLYGIALGYEPAGAHTARGVSGRFFNTITTNGDNLYTRHSVLFTDPSAVEHWLRDYPQLDARAKPLIDVAIYYPETMSQLDDGAFRHLYGWGFNPRAAEVRRHIDADFLDEKLIRAGFLDRYKVLVFCWGNVVEKDVQQIIDRWLRAGGAAIYPARNDQETVEGDLTVFRAWTRGDTGKGAFFRFSGDMEPITLYGDFVAKSLQQVPTLHRWTQAALNLRRPQRVFASVLQNGTLAVLNYSDGPVDIELPGAFHSSIEPFSIWTRTLD